MDRKIIIHIKLNLYKSSSQIGNHYYTIIDCFWAKLETVECRSWINWQIAPNKHVTNPHTICEIIFLPNNFYYPQLPERRGINYRVLTCKDDQYRNPKLSRSWKWGKFHFKFSCITRFWWEGKNNHFEARTCWPLCQKLEEKWDLKFSSSCIYAIYKWSF